jgi:hypothetical protein
MSSAIEVPFAKDEFGDFWGDFALWDRFLLGKLQLLA